MDQPWAKPHLRAVLITLQTMTKEDRSVALSALADNEVLLLLDEERGKFTQSDNGFMGEMIQLLIARKVYPTEWNGKPINVTQRVSGWGANWHTWKNDKTTCPHCKADLRDLKNGPPGLRTIGIYSRESDRTVSYRCPDCHKEWPR